MHSRRALIATGACVYLLVLVVSAPATLADSALRRVSEGHLGLADARGTLWSGEAQLEFRAAQGSGGFAKRVTWRLLPAQLLRARVTYEIALDSGTQAFPVSWSWSRMEVQEADILLPVASLGLAVPRLAPLALTGDLRARIPELSVERGVLSGRATLEWRQAGSRLAPVAPLGDYRVNVEAGANRITAKLDTLQGPLTIAGEGAWSARAQPAFRATAQVPVAIRPQLAPLLRLIAEERPGGRFDLQLN